PVGYSRPAHPVRGSGLMEAYREQAIAEVAEIADVTAPALEVEAVPGRRANLWRDAGRRLVRNKLAICGLLGVSLLLFLAIFADRISPYDYDVQNFVHINEEPTWEFPLGTDLVGRDMLSRMIYGARVSITVALVAQIVILCIAVPLGALAGFRGGWVDLVIMRVVDVFYAIPPLLLAILIMSVLGRGIENLFLALIATGWLTITRLLVPRCLVCARRSTSKQHGWPGRARSASWHVTCCRTR